MTAALAELMAAVREGWIVAALVFFRVGAAAAVLPAFGEQTLPLRIRLAAALAFTAVLTPAVSAEVTAALAVARHPALFFATETVSGLILGLSLRLFVLALQTAGTIAAQATSLAQVFGIASVDPLPTLAHMLMFAGLALATMLGLHVKIAEFLILSYQMMPPGRFPDPSMTAEWGVARSAASFQLAFLISLPFVIVSLLYNLALGVINRAMPQLMVSLVGAPAITAAAMILAALAFPLMLSVWNGHLDLFLADPGR